MSANAIETFSSEPEEFVRNTRRRLNEQPMQIIEINEFKPSNQNSQNNITNQYLKIIDQISEQNIPIVQRLPP